jgi:hypothetical protein
VRSCGEATSAVDSVCAVMRPLPHATGRAGIAVDAAAAGCLFAGRRTRTRAPRRVWTGWRCTERSSRQQQVIGSAAAPFDAENCTASSSQPHLHARAAAGLCHHYATVSCPPHAFYICVLFFQVLWLDPVLCSPSCRGRFLPPF